MSNRIITWVFLVSLFSPIACGSQTGQFVQNAVGVVASCVGLLDQILGFATQFKAVSETCDKAVADEAASRDYKDLRAITAQCSVAMDSYATLQTDVASLKKGASKSVCENIQGDISQYLSDIQSVITLLHGLGYDL